MLNIPGYTLLGAIKSTGTNLLFHAVRDSDGLPLILKTPIGHLARPARARALPPRVRHPAAAPGRARRAPASTPASSSRSARCCCWRRSRASPCPSARASPSRCPAPWSWPSPWPPRSPRSTAAASSTRTSSPPTSSSRPRERRASSTSAAPASSSWSTWMRSTPPSSRARWPYMSPEQTGRMNRSVDYRTDLYSLGITLYELLTGSRPFQGKDALEWFHAHMALAPTPPHERVPGPAARPLRHRPEAAGQGGRGALPERRGAAGRSGAVPGGRCAGARARTSRRACRTPHPLPAPAAALRARRAGRRPAPGLRARGPRAAGPSSSWCAATPASASPRWCTSCTSPWCASAASSSAASSTSSSRTSPTPPWPRPSAG